MDTSKIIIGTVGGGRYTVTAPIVKEDYGLYLKIEGLELPSTYDRFMCHADTIAYNYDTHTLLT